MKFEDIGYPVVPRDSTGRFCPFPKSDPQYGLWDRLQKKAYHARGNWFAAWNSGNRRRHKYWQGVAVKIRDKKLRVLKRLRDRK